MTKQLTIRDEIFDLEVKFVELGISQKAFLREASFAVQMINKNSYLASCSRQSILVAVYNLALTGLTLNPALDYAYLVPRKLKKSDKYPTCVLDISYKGLLKIARDSGAIADVISAECWYENDLFETVEGSSPYIKHIPTNKDRGKISGAYVVVLLTSGIKRQKVMYKNEIDKVRACSQMPDGMPWKDFYSEQGIKTVIKRARKTWAHSEKLASAIHMLNEHEGLKEPINSIQNDLSKRKSEASAPKQIGEGKTTAQEPSSAKTPASKPVLMTKADIAEITKAASKKNIPIEGVCNLMDIGKLEEMPSRMKPEILKYIEGMEG